MSFESEILPETAGLRLCKLVGGELRMSETVVFERGRPSVLVVLARAQLAGHVGGPIDGRTKFWADQVNAAGDHIGEIRLDGRSWNILKNRWLRCRMREVS